MSKRVGGKVVPKARTGDPELDQVLHWLKAIPKLKKARKKDPRWLASKNSVTNRLPVNAARPGSHSTTMSVAGHDHNVMDHYRAYPLQVDDRKVKQAIQARKRATKEKKHETQLRLLRHAALGVESGSDS